jgi:hypothetical protein
MDGGRKNKS